MHEFTLLFASVDRRMPHMGVRVIPILDSPFAKIDCAPVFTFTEQTELERFLLDLQGFRSLPAPQAQAVSMAFREPTKTAIHLTATPEMATKLGLLRPAAPSRSSA
jgi:hypothetical protein